MIKPPFVTCHSCYITYAKRVNPSRHWMLWQMVQLLVQLLVSMALGAVSCLNGGCTHVFGRVQTPLTVAVEDQLCHLEVILFPSVLFFIIAQQTVDYSLYHLWQVVGQRDDVLIQAQFLLVSFCDALISLN